MNRGLAIAAGAIGLVVVGIVAFFLLLGNREQAAEATPSAPVTPSVAATATEAPLDQALLDRRVTVLILGRDMNEDRRERGDEDNTDSIIVLSVNAAHDEVAMLSVPRDTVDVPLPNGETWTDKVNAISRERGFDAMVGAMESLLDVPIDYYVQIDMDDFARLVDGVGGVDVETETPISDPGIDFFLDPGQHHLDGEQALSYVRTRQDGDHARSARQQEVILSMVRAIAEGESDPDLVPLVAGLSSLETDIPLDKLPTFLEIARLSADAEVTRQVLAPPRFALFEGDEGTARGWVMIPNIDEMRAYAAEVMSD